MFLEGKDKDLVERLKKKMEEEAEQLHFEGAAKIRDQIKHLEHVIEKQKMVSSDFVDQDVIGFHRQDRAIIIHPSMSGQGSFSEGRVLLFLPPAFRMKRFYPLSFISFTGKESSSPQRS